MSQKNVVLVSTALLEWERIARLSHLTWTYILINKKGTNLLWHLQHHQADQILMLLKMLSKLYVNTLYHETCLVTTQQSRAGFLSLLHWGHIQKMTVQIQAHSSKPCCCWPTVISRSSSTLSLIILSEEQGHQYFCPICNTFRVLSGTLVRKH